MAGKPARARHRITTRKRAGKMCREGGAWATAVPPVLGRLSHFGKVVLVTARSAQAADGRAKRGAGWSPQILTRKSTKRVGWNVEQATNPLWKGVTEMRRNRPTLKAGHKHDEGLVPERQPLVNSFPEERARPLTLHHVGEDNLTSMQPADMVTLEGLERLRHSVDPAFFAVLACPKCGTLGLITSQQYFGIIPVICGSRLCPCRFRIEDESQLIYLPVN